MSEGKLLGVVARPIPETTSCKADLEKQKKDGTRALTRIAGAPWVSWRWEEKPRKLSWGFSAEPTEEAREGLS